MIKSLNLRSGGALVLAGLLLASPASALTLPFGIGGEVEAPIVAREEAPVVMAQAGDVSVRISQMEEEMRRLTGKVEEMSFLVLQLQEQLRNTQEDNEMRFRDLEGGAGGGGNDTAATPDRRSEAVPAAPAAPDGSGDQEFALGLPASEGGSGGASQPADAAGQPRSDEIASILNSDLPDFSGVQGNQPAPAPAAGAPAEPAGAGSQTVAAIDADGPVELYSLAYNYLLAGDYHLAEQSFRQYAQTYPNSEDAADANYWLGESLFAQSKYRDAAEVFLNAQKSHPKSGKAPEMMLKLGMSLARLDNRDTACVTYAEVERRYPEMSANVKRKLDAEEASANCS